MGSALVMVTNSKPLSCNGMGKVWEGVVGGVVGGAADRCQTHTTDLE